MKKRSMVCRLGKFPQLTRTVFTSADGLASDNITALCYGADNCLYVGTDRGLSKIDGKKITTVDIGIENAPISMLFCANDGHIFVGTGDDHGMYLMACTNYTHPYWFARYYGLIEEAE